MKKIFLPLLALLCFFGCSDDDDFVDPGTLSVELKFPGNYNQDGDLSGIVLKVYDITNPSEVKTVETDKEGHAYWESLVPGTYKLEAEKTFSAKEMFQLIGLSEETTLRVSENNIKILTGEKKNVLAILKGDQVGDFVIKEFYFNGSLTDKGMSYFEDSFLEIYNNSTEVLYADQLLIGDVNQTRKSDEWKKDVDHVYLNHVFRIPGNGTDYPIAPGESFIIANDGMNHKGFNPYGDNPKLGPIWGNGQSVDLSKVEWETYIDIVDGKDVDNATVPNVEVLFFNGKQWDWLPHCQRPTLVIFKDEAFKEHEMVTDPSSDKDIKYVRLPVDLVIDSFCARNKEKDDGKIKDYIALPKSLDKEYLYFNEYFSGKSMRRKVAKTVLGRKVLQNTNCSQDDFDIIDAPTPKGWN